MTVIYESDSLAASSLSDALGGGASIVANRDGLGLASGQRVGPTIVVGPTLATEAAWDLVSDVHFFDPTCGVVLVRQRIDAAMLAAALRAGVREVVTDRDHAELIEAVRRSNNLTSALRNGPAEPVVPTEADGKVLTVFSPKGGAGKTTVATNIAVTLAAAGNKTLLIDLDLAFGDVAISLGLRPEHSTVEVTELGDRLDVAALRRLTITHESGLHVLAAPGEPSAAEHVSAAMLRHLLTVARSEYAYIVVDTAPALDDRSVTVMENSDSVFMVTTLDIPSIKNSKVALRTLGLVNFPMDRIQVVMNRCDAKVGLNASEVEENLGMPVVARIPSSAAVPSATNRGVTVVADQPRHPVSRAFDEFVAGHITHKAPAAKRGIFARGNK